MIQNFIASALIFCTILLFSAKATIINQARSFNTQVQVNTELEGWIEDVNKFREALLTGNRDLVKSYFTFPINEPGNDIWFCVNSRFAASLDPKKSTPFKELDFDKYYSELFGVDFKKTFELIELSKLSTTSTVQSPKIEIIPESKSHMKASIDKARKVLTLEVINEAKAFGKFSLKYQFRILNNSTIKFKNVIFVM
jgi:hypothetical protein